MSALLAFEGTPATTCQGSGYHDPVPLRHVWHHIMPLEAGGQTIAANLAQLCDSCHMSAHRLMWYLRLQSEGTITPDQLATLAHPPRRAQLALAQQGYDACVAAGTVAKILNEG